MDWGDYLDEIHTTYEALIRTLLRFVDVVLISPPTSEIRDEFLREMRTSAHTLYRVRDIELNDTWIRDYGPLSLEDENGGKAVVDFAFNGWGEKFTANKDNQFTRQFYTKGYLLPSVEYRDASDFVFEGGAIDVSNTGHGISTLSVLTYPGRNKESEEDQSARIIRELGLKSLALPNPESLPGDDTDGHVDTLIRYTPTGTLLSCVPLSDETLRDATHHAEYELLPMPNPVIWDSEQKPATYANFLYTNGAIIMPGYGDPVHDDEARIIILRHSGGREVVMVDCRNLVRQNGSLHCATMQIPNGFIDKTKLSKA